MRRSGRRPPLRALIPLFAIASACLLSGTASPGAPRASRPPGWQIYALRYATIPAFPVRALVAGADSTRTLDIAMMFWLIKGSAGRRVLVDAGFYRQKFLDSWKPRDFV